MSWIDKIQSDFVIKTGDSKIYTPFWLNATKSKEYNISEFNFINIKGSLIDRGQSKGTRYNLELYFQGENHLDISSNFYNSADDRRAWTISHPFYGDLKVQPTSLNLDNSDLNVSKITGVVIETLGKVNPSIQVDAKDTIENISEVLNSTNAALFDEDVNPTPGEINYMNLTTNQFYDFNKNLANNNNYYNLFSSATAAVNNAAADTNNAILKVQNFINAPAFFDQSVTTRIEMIDYNLDTLKTSILNFNPTKNAKRIYETFTSALLSTLCVATANPLETDFTTRNEVSYAIGFVNFAYDGYLATLDTLQSGDGSNPSDFIPNADNINLLNGLVNFTISNLMRIAFSAKQERTFTLDCDNDVINLTHQFYGKSSDENITKFMNNNNIGLSEILELKKGREVIYYV